MVFAQQDAYVAEEASLLSCSVTAIFVSVEASLLLASVTSYVVAVEEIFVHAACRLSHTQYAAAFCALQEWNTVRHSRAHTAELLSVSLAQPVYPTRKTLCKYLPSIL